MKPYMSIFTEEEKVTANDIRRIVRKHFKGFISVNKYNTRDRCGYSVAQSNISDITFLIPEFEALGFECEKSPASNMGFVVWVDC